MRNILAWKLLCSIPSSRLRLRNSKGIGSPRIVHTHRTTMGSYIRVRFGLVWKAIVVVGDVMKKERSPNKFVAKGEQVSWIIHTVVSYAVLCVDPQRASLSLTGNCHERFRFLGVPQACCSLLTVFKLHTIAIPSSLCLLCCWRLTLLRRLQYEYLLPSSN